MGMSDIRVRRSRLLRATPRRHPDAGTSFGSQTAHGRQTVREPDVRMSRRYETAAPRGVQYQSDGSVAEVSERSGVTGSDRTPGADLPGVIIARVGSGRYRTAHVRPQPRYGAHDMVRSARVSGGVVLGEDLLAARRCC
jgi:hypothetical protein